MKLYVDDIRDAPEGYTLARTIDSAMNFIFIYKNDIEVISLDHDISLEVEVAGTYRPFPSPETYRAVARYIKSVYANDKHKPKIILHSANPDGRLAMRSILGEDSFNIEDIPAGAAFRNN